MNIQKYTRITLSIFLSVAISYSAINAWNGLVAEDGDVLGISQWNQIVDKISNLTNNSGNLGIDTLTASEKLEVNGNVKATSFIGDGSSLTGIGGGTPAGFVDSYMGSSCPSGYILANGDLISRSTYSDLFTSIGTMYGSGDGSTTFKLPDLRGYFLRGMDGGKGIDPDRTSRTDRGDGTTGDNVGTKQSDMYKSHSHDKNARSSGYRNQPEGTASYMEPRGNGSYYTKASGGSETRPENINVLYCIKL